MKEQFQTILENEELDNEKKVEEIAKIVGEQTIIKSKYNETLSKLKALESEKSTIAEELETLKTNSMTQEERLAKQEQLAKQREVEFAIKTNKLEAEKTLNKAGLKEEDYKELIDGLISEDAETTAKRIEGISKLLQNQKELVTNSTKEELLKSTPRPDETNVNNSDVLTKEQFKKMSGWERAELYKSNKDLFDKLTNS